MGAHEGNNEPQLTYQIQTSKSHHRNKWNDKIITLLEKDRKKTRHTGRISQQKAIVIHKK